MGKFVRVSLLAFAALVTAGLAGAGEEGNWEKFKEGMKKAGEAVAGGTKNAAQAVASGARKTGQAIAEGYEATKDYLEEKTADDTETALPEKNGE
jgi:hypothetical protein